MTEAPHPARQDLTRTMFAVLFMVGLIAACFWILRPFRAGPDLGDDDRGRDVAADVAHAEAALAASLAGGDRHDDRFAARFRDSVFSGDRHGRGEMPTKSPAGCERSAGCIYRSCRAGSSIFRSPGRK